VKGSGGGLLYDIIIIYLLQLGLHPVAVVITLHNYNKILTVLSQCSHFSYKAIFAFLENTALWKNRVIETIGSTGIKESISLTAILLFRL
jgi:hypothetical protein